MNSALEKLIRELRSGELSQRQEALCTLSLLWEWQVLGRRDSADLLSDPALLQVKFLQDELEVAFNDVERIAGSEVEEIPIRLSALHALCSAKKFKCVEIGAQLLAEAKCSTDELAEIMFYISPFAGSAQFQEPTRRLLRSSGTIGALQNLKQSEDKRLAEGATRLLNSLR